MTGKRTPRSRWTDAELAVLREVYPTRGVEAAAEQLPGRALESIKQKAFTLGLSDPTRQTRGLVQALTEAQVDRAMALKASGWGCERIGRELGVCEAAVSNAIMRRRCIESGHTPARRDSTGAIVMPDVKRIRALLFEGRKHVEIQLLMGISASAVSHQRRRLEAELKAKRKSHLLPSPGGGVAYSGLKLSREKRREVEALLLEGFGGEKIHARTGVSKTSIQRIRLRLVRRLARKGETLPGCDKSGVRRRQVESIRFIPASIVAEFRRLLLDRWPVLRAAHATTLGVKGAYDERDRFAAELEAQGAKLPAPVLPGRNPRLAAKARWCPPGWEMRFRELCHAHPFADAKRLLLDEFAADSRARNQAAASRRLTFDEQLALAAERGVQLRPVLTRGGPAMTLGGVATGMM